MLRQTVGALGIDDSVIEVTRDAEWGLACTRVQVRDEGLAPLRHLADMEQMIGAAGLSEAVRTAATEAVRRLAGVEAAIHGCSMEQIHFHEVGAVDTLVDVVGVLALVEALGVEEVLVGTIPVGGGTVEIAHGRMGVPAPATERLLVGYDIVGGPEMRELTTPTGALLVGQLGARQGTMPAMRPRASGVRSGLHEAGERPERATGGTGKQGRVRGQSGGRGCGASRRRPGDRVADQSRRRFTGSDRPCCPRA